MLVMSNLAMVKADPGTGSTTLEIRQLIVLAQPFLIRENMAHILAVNNLAIVEAHPKSGSTTLEIRQIIGLGQTFRHHLTLLALSLDPRLRDLVIRFLKFASPRMTHEQPLSGWP